MKERYVGKGIGRTEGMAKAEGKAMYAGDYYEENMLHVAVVRSPIAHGIVKCIDSSALPEDVYFFTADDLAENVVDDIIQEMPVLANTHVRYHKEPVALVAAETPEKAREAAASVKVICEELPVIRNVYDAMEPDAVKIHENGNELVHFYNEKGNTEEAFAACEYIVDGSFSVPVQDHGYMEPEASFARIAEDGRLEMYTSTQNIYNDQRMICRALGISASQVHVTAAVVGGGFGGKDGHTNQIFTALVTWKTGRPSKCVFDRTESLTASYKRHAAEVYVKIGVDKEGMLKAFEGRGYLDTGAYAGLGTAVLALFSEHLAGPYAIPNVKIESKLLYTNKMPAHAMRGFGAPQGAAATEILLNQLAEKLGMDPIDFRYQNALEYGSIGSLGQKMEHCVDFRGALKLVKESALWKERLTNKDPYIGYGIAGGHLSCGLGKNIEDTARVEILALGDDRYEVRVGLVDIGQGSTTALQAMAADVLETDFDKIIMVMADSDRSFDCGSTAGSRSTFIAGNAILKAAAQLKETKNGRGDGHAAFPESDKEFVTPGFPHAMYTFIAQAVKLRLNPVTGEIELLDIFAATEAGRVINPLSMAGQMQGGVAMSVGYAMMEQCLFDDQGRLRNPDFSTYLLPTSMDVSSIASEHVEAFEASGPLGVKGAAEVATVSIAPAIGNAIYEISGEVLHVLPYDKYTILTALRKLKAKKEEEMK